MKTRILTLLSTMITISLLYQNCGQSAFGPMGMNADNSSQSNSSDESNEVTIPIALLSAEQVFKSMSSVTGVAPTGGIVNEYNNRQTLLGSGFDLKLTTSPMLVGITNLSSTFCNELLTREIAQPVENRRFLASIDFSKPVVNVTEASYSGVLAKFSEAFWGREIVSEEKEILSTGKSEFVEALTVAERSQNNSTRNLLLFTCSGMLSSFDSVTF